MPCLEDSISVLVSIRQLLYLPSLLFQCSLNHGHRVQQSCLVLGWALSSFFFLRTFVHLYSSLLTTVKYISIPGQTESTQVYRYKQHYLEGSVTDSVTTGKITITNSLQKAHDMSSYGLWNQSSLSRMKFLPEEQAANPIKKYLVSYNRHPTIDTNRHILPCNY